VAQVPYEHIEAPRVIRMDGVRAFNPGDPIPVDTARRLGLLDTEDAPTILSGTGVASSPQFSDAELKVHAAEAAAAAGLSPADPAVGTTSPPATGDANPATPPQAPAVAPTKGRAAPTTP